ncbi:cytochrome P450 (plasmid) [Rhizobium leguminosarum]|uniref:cytochrome P450 n=1 Tax=Rhizobium TaxID=379 RepID=UPI001030543D|nr:MULTISPECIES: cytochrome P450 [Rhizobium]MBY5378337.1 cytochrome P450 [Rhizobium leguminosarum]TBF88013.1 cytochrome P450 [Rhizobium leguminosarum]WSH48629.1 cytochrome P450 [Rhizobium johnstonii]
MLTIAELNANPHAAFERWRAAGPCVDYEGGGKFVLRHDDVVKLSSDPRVVATGTALPESRGVVTGVLHDIFGLGMLTANGAQHQARRSIISRGLATVLASDLRSQVRAATEKLIDAVYENGSAEFVSQFANPIPILALAGLLGVEVNEQERFVSRVEELGRFFAPASTDADIAVSSAAAEYVRDYLEWKLREKTKSETPDFLSAVKAQGEAEGLAPIETVVQIIQLILGGTESVRASLAAQISLLLQHRSQWNSVCGDASLIPSAVSETMRYEPGIAGLVRATAEPVELQETTLPANCLVILSTMSALRDERIFKRPNTFDIHRDDLPRLHLAFGAGAHRCVADHLARAELEEVLAVFAARLPKLRLEDFPVFGGHLFIRTPSSFCVSWPR